MKRVIAVSDSHGSVRCLREAFEQASRAGAIDVAVFLGDGLKDFAQVRPLLEAAGTTCYAVSGNNDWGSYEGQELVFSVEGVRFFACHGHTRYVKYSLDRLWYAGSEREAQVALYGHTHRAGVELERGMYLVNPGAICERTRGGTAYAEFRVEANGGLRVRLVPWGE